MHHFHITGPSTLGHNTKHWGGSGARASTSDGGGAGWRWRLYPAIWAALVNPPQVTGLRSEIKLQLLLLHLPSHHVSSSRPAFICNPHSGRPHPRFLFFHKIGPCVRSPHPCIPSQSALCWPSGGVTVINWQFAAGCRNMTQFSSKALRWAVLFHQLLALQVSESWELWSRQLEVWCFYTRTRLFSATMSLQYDFDIRTDGKTKWLFHAKVLFCISHFSTHWSGILGTWLLTQSLFFETSTDKNKQKIWHYLCRYYIQRKILIAISNFIIFSNGFPLIFTNLHSVCSENWFSFKPRREDSVSGFILHKTQQEMPVI